MNDPRPDPDRLLSEVAAQERRAGRGRLRIYFGASAGVGKTYAMLAAARAQAAQGQQVVAGIVETHGRSETAVLLDGLEAIPLKRMRHRDRDLGEFDLDAALARRPALILVDELAHANVPGSRHPRRWQDVAELLAAGIDVYTTLNVQHLESLNDVVGGITGVRVAETVPDKVFDEAGEVVLVDVPADELLARLRAGKVYQGPQAERAAQNFFRKGNLMALRELALRRTADRVEGDVQDYRVEQSISAVWKTDADLLAGVGPDAGAEQVIRSSARLASQLGARWHAVYVETPRLQRLPPAQRERILQRLKLAQELGASTAVLAGGDVAGALVGYARSHNLSRIVIGRPGRAWALAGHAALAARVAQRAPDADIVQTGRSGPGARSAGRQEDASGLAPRSRSPRRYLLAAAACAVTTVLAAPLLPYLDLANIVMLFLLAEVLVAARCGRGPAVLAAFMSVAAFDFFFVPPRLSFAVSDVQYLVTFAVMLIVGLTVGQLTAGLRFQANIALRREARARALYEYARALSAALQAAQIQEITSEFMQKGFRAKAALLLPDAAGRLQIPLPPDCPGQALPAGLDAGIAQWAFDHGSAAGIGTDTLPGSRLFYLPLPAPMRLRGVMALEPESRRWLLIPEQRQQLDTFAALAAIALERVHYIEVAQDALLRMESERLRNSLLAALSHDLRTPLTSLVGMSEALAMSGPPLAPAQQALARQLREEAGRMARLVSNLLDMARIQSGDVRLNLQWLPIEEVAGSALRACSAVLAGHRVGTRLPASLPLVRFDAVLIERVLCNLLENAARYTPPGSSIVIAAAPVDSVLEVTVSDNGPGLPAGREPALFEKFTRGEKESASHGVGLGLAICKAIVEAHHGVIHAGRSAEGGAAMVFTLPLGTPPPFEPGEAEQAAMEKRA